MRIRTFLLNGSMVVLDGNSLTPEDLDKLSYGGEKAEMDPEAVERVMASRAVIDGIVEREEIVYGVTTGFGLFEKSHIAHDDVSQLQVNLIRSHAAGVGPLLPKPRVRALMALRMNVLLKGKSGIRLETLQRYLDAFNADCIPCVPEQGTVGASGDLCPLAHLALSLMGESEMFDPKTGEVRPSADVMRENGLKFIELEAKEGLALINGTQFMTAIGSEAVLRAESLCRQADVIAAMSLEALKCTFGPMNPLVHSNRPHAGQIHCAEVVRKLGPHDDHPSLLSESHKASGRIQDAYSARCLPQIHGVCADTIKFVKGIITTEMNSATDNPMVFTKDDADSIGMDRPHGFTCSGGNFHGEYPAMVLDFLAIAVNELANVSECRIEFLLNPSRNRDLPAFLTSSKEAGGLNSGLMIAQYTAAALVSEGKVLCHPSVVDSIPTSAGQEDHVSMGGMSARKAMKVVENAEKVLGIELLSACDALSIRKDAEGLTTTEPLTKVWELVRSVVPMEASDSIMYKRIGAAADVVHDGKVWETVTPYLD